MASIETLAHSCLSLATCLHFLFYFFPLISFSAYLYWVKRVLSENRTKRWVLEPMMIIMMMMMIYLCCILSLALKLLVYIMYPCCYSRFFANSFRCSSPANFLKKTPCRNSPLRSRAGKPTADLTSTFRRQWRMDHPDSLRVMCEQHVTSYSLFWLCRPGYEAGTIFVIMNV